MFACLMLLAVPLAFVRPFNAYLLWGWTGMMVPTSYFYGFMADARVNLVFAVLTILTIFLGRVRLQDYQNNRVTWLYLLFVVHCTASFLLGYANNPLNAHYYEIVVKLMAFALLMPLFVRERIHFHAMFLIIALGLGLHGVLSGLKTLASAGGHNMLGPYGTMIGDRNHLSTALVLTLPVLYYLFTQSERRVMRLAFLGGLAAVAMAVLGSGSRGGFLAISVVAVWLVLTSRRKTLALSLALVGAVAFVSFAPERWTDRLSTIQKAQDDESFQGRMIAWRVSTAVATANPVFGGGFHAVQAFSVWEQFKAAPGLLGFLDLPIPEFAPKAAHSIYFEVLGDLGFIGLGIFLFIIAHAIWSRWRIVGMIGKNNPQLIWARDMADMLMLSILAFAIGGAAVSLAYFEVIYIVIMLMELLRIHVSHATQIEREKFYQYRRKK